MSCATSNEKGGGDIIFFSVKTSKPCGRIDTKMRWNSLVCSLNKKWRNTQVRITNVFDERNEK